MASIPLAELDVANGQQTSRVGQATAGHNRRMMLVHTRFWPAPAETTKAVIATVLVRAAGTTGLIAVAMASPSTTAAQPVTAAYAEKRVARCGTDERAPDLSLGKAAGRADICGHPLSVERHPSLAAVHRRRKPSVTFATEA